MPVGVTPLGLGISFVKHKQSNNVIYLIIGPESNFFSLMFL